MTMPRELPNITLKWVLVCLCLCAGNCPLDATAALVKRSQYLMGTLVFVTGVAPTEAMAHRAVDAGLKEIRRLELLWSTWKPETELSRVNRAAGRRAISVSDETLALITHSLDMYRHTEGGFNIAVGPAVKLWNVSEEARIPTRGERHALRSVINIADVRLDRNAKTLFLAREGMQVDVGGIAKGFAADLVVDVMKTAGATAGVVAISGDIKTFGRMPDGQPFVFGIQHPRREQGHVLGSMTLENEAVSTAGDYQRYFERDGVRYHHILDPGTLLPARGCQSVTVVASTGVMADGLDTGVFVMGPKAGMALIERLPRVEGVIVSADGTVSVSSGLRDRMTLYDETTERSKNR